MKYLSLLALPLAFAVSAFAFAKQPAKSAPQPNKWSTLAEKRTPSSTENQTLVVRQCDDATPLELTYFVEKKDFSKGNVRVFSVDTHGEPACCSSHLVVYMPLGDEPGEKCFHIASAANGLGFLGSNLKNIVSSYDEKKGISLKLPISFYNVDADSSDNMSTMKKFEIVVNQKSKTVTVK